MSIVCDTDFSPGAQQAGRAAAFLVQRLSEKLHLVHVVDELGAELMLGGDDEEAIFHPEREMLHREAEALRQLGARVEERLVAGLRHVRLAQIARVCQARLVVTSRHSEGWLERLFGGSVERTIWSSPAPVLIIEDSDCLVEWLRGERCLRVLVGIDDSAESRAALHWLADFGCLERLQTLVATIHRKLSSEHLRARSISGVVTGGPAHPYRDRHRVEPQVPVDPHSTPSLHNDLHALPRGIAGTTWRIEVVTSHPAVELLRLAEREQIDLLVMARDLLQGRVWRVPVWRAVFQSSLPCSTVCVPTAYAPTEVSKSSRRTLLSRRARRRRSWLRSFGAEKSR